MAPDDRANRNPSSGMKWPVALVLILVAVLVWQVVLRDGSPLHDSQAEPRAVTARGDLAEDEQAAIELFKQASKSAVHITTLAVQRDPFSLRVQEIPI